MFSLGIDLGGTYTKAVILSETYEIIAQMKTETHVSGNCEEFAEHLFQLAVHISQKCNIDFSDISKRGLAVPGIVKMPGGPVLFAPNIGWYNTDPVKLSEQKLKMPVFLGNDADCMALAESRIGAGQKYRHFLMLTLGTAVGGALIYDGELFTGFGPYGGELGHIPLCHGGFPCSCGVNGCFEQYGSAEALKRIALSAMEKDHSSLLWAMCSGKSSQLKTEHVFSAVKHGDRTAEEALDEFVLYLCEGMAGLINIFRPEAVILGGGLANAGPLLFDRVNQTLPGLTYASEYIPAPPVIRAMLGTCSGAAGAAMLGEKQGK